MSKKSSSETLLFSTADAWNVKLQLAFTYSHFEIYIWGSRSFTRCLYKM